MTPELLTRDALLGWLADGRPFAIALLVNVSGSAPLDTGAMMLIDENMHIEGSLTGGCVESVVAAEAQELLTGADARVRTFGISDELAGDVGLMCGGEVSVFLYRVDENARLTLGRAVTAVQHGWPVALATVLDGPAAGGHMAVVDGDFIGRIGEADELD